MNKKYRWHPVATEGMPSKLDEDVLSTRRKGYWKDKCSCSVCNWIHEDDHGFALLTDYNFCPNCGADMRGRTNG